MTQAPQHQLPPTASVATTILQRRQGPRQRFDSADYAMALQHQKKFASSHAHLLPSHATPQNINVPTPVRSPATSSDFSDWVQCELEPEPDALDDIQELHGSIRTSSSSTADDGTHVPPQSVRRIRLQRFDSADWAMQNSQAQRPEDSASCPNSVTNSVAKLRLDRHAYQTCHFVTTPIDAQPQHFVKNA